MYILNTCQLSGVFGQRFGLLTFKSDYEALVDYCNVNVSNRIGVHDYLPKNYSLNEYLRDREWRLKHQTYRKLCKLFDDFNWFINISLLHKSRLLINLRFGQFMCRVSRMNIGSEYKARIGQFFMNQHACFLGEIRFGQYTR